MYFQIKTNMNTSLTWLSVHTHTHTHTHTYIHIYLYFMIISWLFDHSHKNRKIFPFLWLWFDAMIYCQNFRHDVLSAVFLFFDTWKLVDRFSFSLTYETLSAVFCPNCYVCNVILKSCKMFVVFKCSIFNVFFVFLFLIVFL